MIVSEVTGNVDCKRIEVKSMEEVAALMYTKTISPSFFKDDYRNNKNFEGADFIMLDIDENCTLVEALKKFKNYKYAIATTRNHQKEKNGIVADRFRVLLQLEERITNPQDFKATYEELAKEFPFLDEQCKDPSRQFFPSPGKVKKRLDGELVKVRRWVEKKEEKIDIKLKAKLLPSTLNFIAFGAPKGRWNHEINIACFDLRRQGYSKEEATALLRKATGRLDDKDTGVIESVYNKEDMEPPRGMSENPFNFVKIKEILHSKEKLDWLVEGVLTRGGLSIFAGPPKSGKSTLVRQLTKCMVTGDHFLNRKVTQGRVLYLALEEQAALLKEQFKKVGIKDDHDIMVHVGSVYGESRFEYLKQYALEYKPDFIVVDTLFLFMQFENGNDYGGVNEAMTVLRDLARETNSHVIAIHHTNKGEALGPRSIMGSGALFGAVDCAIILSQFGQKRKISTTGRGIKPFDMQEIDFDPLTETYHIAEKKQRGPNEF